MKASELRIGNLVKTCTPGMKIMIPFGEWQVQGLTISGEAIFKGFNMGERHLAGIPLTEEWFTRMGFKSLSLFSHGENWIGIDAGNGFIYRFRGELHVGNGDYNGGFPVSCEYVHQLQNLYFASTGEELLIKN
jgi:hypothetical protein